MERSNESSTTHETSEAASLAAGGHRYKACQTCRRQKMRCDGSEGVPCRRCIRAGVGCVFDLTTTSRRQLSSNSRVNKKKQPQQQQLQSGSSRDADLKAQIAVLVQQDQRTSQQMLPRTESQPVYGTTPTQTSTDLCLENSPNTAFSPCNLGIPVTAVHVMMQQPLKGEPERNYTGWTVENQSRWHKEEHTKNGLRGFVLSGLVSEDETRCLFDLYMHGANVFLPIFDPVVDTYESVRESSVFLFVVVLYVAARHKFRDDPYNQVLSSCKEQAQHLAAESLFENPSSLETAEAMTILANYSEKTWFALGHAYQIATDLGLETKLQRLAQAPSSLAQTSRQTRITLRCARTFLLIVQYERSTAFGTRREPRTRELSPQVMERFLNYPNAHPSDVAACAAIDLVQYLLRVQVGMERPTREVLDDTVDAWLDRWDSHLENDCVHRDSFQRSYLRVQHFYAKIICGGMLFAQLERNNDQSASPIDHDPIELGREIVCQVQDLLRYIDNCGPFQRTFSWAPTYDGILLTFAVILAVQILMMYPTSGNLASLLTEVERTSLLLQQHPCVSFHQVVQALIHRSKSACRTGAATSHTTSAQPTDCNGLDFESFLQGANRPYDLTESSCPDDGVSAWKPD